MDSTQFKQHARNRGVKLSEQQLKKFEKYIDLLLEWNQKMNLTAITERREIYEKHFFDSISASFFFDFSKIATLADIGAGAGFPSLPLKIVFPHLQITIVDSLNKRICFLRHLVDELELNNVVCVHARAEELGARSDYRERFDAVTARAVARLNILSEYCIPFAKVGGSFIVLKGADALQELEEAKKAIQVLGGKMRNINHFRLPSEQADRNIIVIDKWEPTPKKYPRKPGVPAKKPIG